MKLDENQLKSRGRLILHWRFPNWATLCHTSGFDRRHLEPKLRLSLQNSSTGSFDYTYHLRDVFLRTVFCFVLFFVFVLFCFVLFFFNQSESFILFAFHSCIITEKIHMLWCWAHSQSAHGQLDMYSSCSGLTTTLWLPPSEVARERQEKVSS